jgi:hypothetical protein
MHHNVIDSNISHIDCGQEWLAAHMHICGGAGVHNGFLKGSLASSKKGKRKVDFGKTLYVR